MSAYNYVFSRRDSAGASVDLASVQSFRAFRGRRRNIDTYAAGSFSMTLFDPSETIELNDRIWIKTISGTPTTIGQAVFFGYITDLSWQYYYDSDGDVLTVQGVDLFGALGQVTVSYSQAAANAGRAIKDIFDYAIDTLPVGIQSIDGGSGTGPAAEAQSDVSAQTYTNRQAIEIFNELCATEQGRLWTDTIGEQNFRSRNKFDVSTINFSDTTNNATNQVYKEIQFTTSAQDYFTQIVVKPVGLASQEAIAFDAVEPYRSYQITTQDATTEQAKNLAEYLANNYSSQTPEIAVIKCLAEAQNTPKLTEIDLADKVTVTFRGQTYTMIIEGIEISATPEASEYTFYVSPADRNAYLILDDTTFGRLDFNKLGF